MCEIQYYGDNKKKKRKRSLVRVMLAGMSPRTVPIYIYIVVAYRLMRLSSKKTNTTTYDGTCRNSLLVFFFFEKIFQLSRSLFENPKYAICTRNGLAECERLNGSGYDDRPTRRSNSA